MAAAIQIPKAIGALLAPAPWLLGEEGWRALVAEFTR
jgi:hypothetical protein